MLNFPHHDIVTPRPHQHSEGHTMTNCIGGEKERGGGGDGGGSGGRSCKTGLPGKHCACVLVQHHSGLSLNASSGFAVQAFRLLGGGTAAVLRSQSWACHVHDSR